MGRVAVAVIAGYFGMFLVVALSFTALQFALGMERVFKPGSYEVSGLFMACAVLLSFAAAGVAGIVCAAIAGRGAAVLAVAIVVLGVGTAAYNLKKPAPGPRTPDVSPADAALRARQPAWYALALPLIQAGGVLLAARWWGATSAASRGRADPGAAY